MPDDAPPKDDASSPPAATPGRRLISVVVSLVLLGAIAWTFQDNVRQWNFLGDDCFISFRYSKHLVDGHGLVWNPGERVEGYTNFSWVLLMAAGMKYGLEPEWFSRVVGIASGSLLLLLMAGWGIRRHGWSNPLVWTVPAVFATSRTYAAWCTSGLETMFYTMLLAAAALAWVRDMSRGHVFPWLSALLFALASLTRPDGLLFSGIAGTLALLTWLGRSIFKWKFELRPLLGLTVWTFLYAAIVGGHLLWRHSYYGYWLPNTYYAKVPGVWWEQGQHYLQLFHQTYDFFYFLPLVLIPLLLRRDRICWYFACASGAYLTYVAAVGGDRFEFRFLVVVFPLVYGLIGDGLAELWNRGRGILGIAVKVVALAIAAGLITTTWMGSSTKLTKKERDSVAGLGGIRRYANNRVEQGKILRQAIEEGRLPSDVILGVGGAGAIPYYTEWITVDFRGLNDETIAHTKIHKEERGGIAHERKATMFYLRDRKVEILDAGNRLVKEDDGGVSDNKRLRYGSREITTRAFKLDDDVYIVFGTFLTDAQLRRRFPEVELITPGGRRGRQR